MIALRIIREEFKKQLSIGKLKLNVAVGKGMTLNRIQDFLTSFYSRDVSTFQLKNSVLQRQSLWQIVAHANGGGAKSKQGSKRPREAEKGSNSAEAQSTPTSSTDSITPSKSVTNSHSILTPSSQDQVGRRNTRHSAAKTLSSLSQPHPSTPNPNPSPTKSNSQEQGSSTSSDANVLRSGQGGQSGSQGNQSRQFQELVKLSEGFSKHYYSFHRFSA